MSQIYQPKIADSIHVWQKRIKLRASPLAAVRAHSMFAAISKPRYHLSNETRKQITQRFESGDYDWSTVSIEYLYEHASNML